jgi:hypothetical protein
MKLLYDALIAAEKVTSCLLQWRSADDKSAFLSWAGYTLENSRRLLDDIREQQLPLTAESIECTEYGPKYMIRGTLTGPNGNVLRVAAIWMTEEATGSTKFITPYPDKK